MEKVFVPEDKCPLDVIAELGDRTKDAHIFLESSLIEQLKNTADEFEEKGHIISFLWEETEKFPRTELMVRRVVPPYYEAIKINASDIAFTTPVEHNPGERFFLKRQA